MQEPAAIIMALDLLHRPSRVWDMRSAPLPSDVGMLLQIAAGDLKAASEAVAVTGRPVEAIQGAAAFFIEQILFYSEADSYRVLGVNPQATSKELRHNMALLLSWLHPDIERGGTRSLFATNVTNAWNDLKTDERRALYDGAHQMVVHPRDKKSHGRRLGRVDAVNLRPTFASRAHHKPVAVRRSVFDAPAKRGLMSRFWLFLKGRPGS